jgi:hypothetical protein
MESLLILPALGELIGENISQDILVRLVSEFGTDRAGGKYTIPFNDSTL